jgi:hypothetical protein
MQTLKKSTSSRVPVTVLMQDRDSDRAIPRSLSATVIRKPDMKVAESATNLFVFSAATRLSSVEEFVQAANRHHHLRALFVKEDVDPKWLPQMLNRANLRMLRNVIVHSGPEVPRRVMFAWQAGAQEKLIANAALSGDKLFVVNCALEQFEVSFNDIRALKDIPVEERGSFEIAEDGSYIAWKKSDVHIDMDAIRASIDKEFREQLEAKTLATDRKFGEAVSLLRKKAGLRQSDIKGLSERQVRRIENGERPRVASLKLLAEAHGMALNEYLKEVAQTIKQWDSQL